MSPDYDGSLSLAVKVEYIFKLMKGAFCYNNTPNELGILIVSI